MYLILIIFHFHGLGIVDELGLGVYAKDHIKLDQEYVAFKFSYITPIYVILYIYPIAKNLGKFTRC